MNAANHPAWLTARPIAHRGLHDRVHGVIENTISAARAAIAANYAIECDIQLSADGEAMVFHDFSLERLTMRQALLHALPAAELQKVVISGGPDFIPTLSDFLAAIDSRTPLVCEIKSNFDGDMRLVERAASIARDYKGPFCFKSFDPRVMAHLRANAARLGIPQIPLGMISMAAFDDPTDEWAGLSAAEKRALAAFAHFPQTHPDFLSFGVHDLPHATALLCRQALGMPVMTWAVRTPDEVQLAKQWADQMVFEGFRP